MRPDYLPYFHQLTQRLADLGIERIEVEGELFAKIILNSGWAVEFEGERYYGPSFTISIVSPSKESCKPRSYVVWLLMRVFEKLLCKDFSSFSVDKQADFLIAEKALVFGDESFYRDPYTEINNASL